ncbi:unnamed protein product [Bemisia tabaci]|uniref:Transmembrane protein n=1 Tax=Bemisia tabaci TaxID=7038 RepID=A0A9P0AFA8_BEMTA|nr:PREDICTED: uncharacterized protein LOC109042567 [Bemisia tabaci]CAH0389498.1 unnamed protein product [Bemisia tabaci]
MDILSAAVISYGMWFILNSVYIEIVSPLIFKRTKDYRMPIISWELLFSGFCFVTCLNNLPASDMFSSFTFSNYHLPSNLSSAFMIGGFMHSVSRSVTLKGINSCLFWRQISLSLLSTSAFKLGCVDFLFKAVLVISIMDQLLWFIRALCNLEKMDSEKSWILSIMSTLYCILWCFVYLFLMPSYMIIPAAFTRTNSESIPHLLVLNLSLWICFLCEFINSPALQVIKELFLYQTINVDLFTFKENFLTRSNFVLLKKQLEKEKQKVERLQKAVPKQENQEQKINKKMNPGTVIQTIKCYMAMKRRLKNVRERAQFAETSNNPEQDQEDFIDEDIPNKSE